MSDRTIRRILYLHLKFHPFKIMIVQELIERDWENRMACWEAILKNVFANAVLFSDNKVHFHLKVTFNKQNYGYWVENNPHQLYDNFYTVLMLLFGVLLQMVELMALNFYRKVAKPLQCMQLGMCTTYEPKLQNLGYQEMWFQQDGVISHTARISMALLRELLLGCLISLYSDIRVGLHNHSISPLRLQKNFFWPSEDSKWQEITIIIPQPTQQVIRNFRSWLNMCITNEGHYLNDFQNQMKKLYFVPFHIM